LDTKGPQKVSRVENFIFDIRSVQWQSFGKAVDHGGSASMINPLTTDGFKFEDY
jgi:hypothetical protein